MLISIQNKRPLRTMKPIQPQTQSPESQHTPNSALPDSADIGEAGNSIASASALLLPIMDPAFQLSLGYAVISVAMGGAFGTALNASVEGATQIAGVGLTKTQVLTDASGNSTLSGSVAGRTIMGGKLTLHEETSSARWEANYGGAEVSLEISEDEEADGIIMQGLVGPLETRLAFSQDHAAEDNTKILVSGHLGGNDYRMETTIDEIPKANDRSTFNIESKGQVGSIIIDKMYQGTSETNSSLTDWEITGSGYVAAVPQDIKITGSVSSAE